LLLAQLFEVFPGESHRFVADLNEQVTARRGATASSAHHARQHRLMRLADWLEIVRAAVAAFCDDIPNADLHRPSLHEGWAPSRGEQRKRSAGWCYDMNAFLTSRGALGRHFSRK
jgi:hypothetical protein